MARESGSSAARTTGEPSDTLEHGRGHPARHTGCIKSAFRGSDDATTFPFSIPENAYGEALWVAACLRMRFQDMRGFRLRGDCPLSHAASLLLLPLQPSCLCGTSRPS